MENSLDAAESANILPDIELSIIEYVEEDHNERYGILTSKTSKSKSNPSISATSTTTVEFDGAPLSQSSAIAKGKTSASGNIIHSASTTKEQKYYRISCKDNGCGMMGSQIGESFGRVLSGSKHGVKQTRGKYGLGAKMVSAITSIKINIYCIFILFYFCIGFDLE